MNAQLIQGQHLIDSFIELLGVPLQPKNVNTFTANTTGRIDPEEIPSHIQNKVFQLFTSVPIYDDKYRELFNGDTSRYGDDHSSADLALIGYCRRNGLNPKEADQVFRASNLFRNKWDELRGDKTYGEMTIERGFGAYGSRLSPQINKPAIELTAKFKFKDPHSYQPIYMP